MNYTGKKTNEIAMARFASIAPVINKTFTEQSAAAYCRRIAQTPFILPDGTTKHYSPRTYEDWVRKYKREGIEGLMPAKRSDIGFFRKLSEEAISALYSLKNRHPKINATMCYEKLIEDGIISKTEVSLSTVQRFFRYAFHEAGNDVSTKDRRSFESGRVNGIWQADTLYGPYMKNSHKRAYIQTIIDDKSRLIVASRAYDADNAINFQATLKAAIRAWGIPEKLYVDNGSAYRNDQLNMICGQLGIVLLHAPVRDGAAKGKIERVNRTLRMRFLSMLETKDTEHMEVFNDALSTWVCHYNTKVHSSTDKRPQDIFAAEAPLLKVPKSDAWLDECFLNRIARTVSKDGLLRISKADFESPLGFIGQRVEVRYDPTDMSKVILVEGDRLIDCFPVDRVSNASTKRQNPNLAIDWSKTDRQEGERNV